MKKKNNFWRAALVLLALLFLSFKEKGGDKNLKEDVSGENEEGTQENPIILPEEDFKGVDGPEVDVETDEFFNEVPVYEGNDKTECVDVETFERQEDVNPIVEPEKFQPIETLEPSRNVSTGGSGGGSYRIEETEVSNNIGIDDRGNTYLRRM